MTFCDDGLRCRDIPCISHMKSVLVCVHSSYERTYTDKYRCMWKPIKHYAMGPEGPYYAPKVPGKVITDCNNDLNCKFVYANGQNLYTCGPSDSKSGYDSPNLPIWNKVCKC